MFRFFCPGARVIIVTSVQPQGSIPINPQPWQAVGDDLPVESAPPLRRSYNMGRALPGDGIVHVSVVTGERHVHGEVEEVDYEPGMLRVISENPRPQRPLDDGLYQIFIEAIKAASFGLFQRQAIRTTREVAATTNLSKDPCAIVVSYLSPS